MIRLIFTELALFLVPFAAYALFVWATHEGLVDPVAWSAQRLAWLTAIAVGLTAGSFFLIAEFAGAPPGAAYVPAHLENGRLVPGTMK